MPLVTEPEPVVERSATETSAQDRQDMAATESAEPRVIAPLEVPGATPAVDQESEGVPPWLRLLEVGLGFSVVTLGVLTLILRWRRI
jgi:hypothetical protein